MRKTSFQTAFRNFWNKLFTAIVIASTVFNNWVPATPVRAAAVLSVTPITWNIIGLDSNSPTTGPYLFPVGARVCNTSNTDTATNVKSSFTFSDGLNAYTGGTYINLRTGTLSAYTSSGVSLAPNACMDFYYEVQVTKDANAYNTSRAYYITVTADGGLSVSTPKPRELFVEHLISQNRNSITDIKLNGTSVPAGGNMSLMEGKTYTITLVGGTATQGYNQFEEFINFPNTIFQIVGKTTNVADGVLTSYSANTAQIGRAHV